MTQTVGYDWNHEGDRTFAGLKAPVVHDETLRDGLQAPSVVDPPIETKLELLHLLAELGVGSVNVGLPGASQRNRQDTLAMCREIVDSKLGIDACCAGRTVVADLVPMVEVSQKVGVPVEAMIFIGSSLIRQYVEGWSVELLLKRTIESIEFAVREGLKVTYVTEDTTRSPPAILWSLFNAAIDAGAARLCLCDTVGHATPDGAMHLVQWTRTLISTRGVDIGIDWHGHEDRGFALANTLSAYAAGATRLHGCVLGVGERVGNAPLELLLRNLALEGRGPYPPTDAVVKACRLVAGSMNVPIAADHPYVGAAPSALRDSAA